MISSVIYPQKAVSKTTQAEETTAVSGGSTGSETQKTGADDFESLLKGIINKDSTGQVSEEELFAAGVGERISSLKGEEAKEAYVKELEAQRAGLKKADGYIPHEQAAINALKSLVTQGVITQEEGDKIYSQAFAASQLDSNKTSLYDDRGGANDPTVAVSKMEAALAGIRALIEKIDAGEETVSSMALSAAQATGTAGGNMAASSAVVTSNGAGPVSNLSPNGNYVDGAEGFLFKPITNNQNKLAVLLGVQDAGMVASVLLKDQQDNLIESGVLSTAGRAETGRDKWNFSKQGGQYPKDLVVEVVYNDGSIKRYSIPDPSKRYD